MMESRGSNISITVAAIITWFARCAGPRWNSSRRKWTGLSRRSGASTITRRLAILSKSTGSAKSAAKEKTEAPGLEQHRHILSTMQHRNAGTRGILSCLWAEDDRPSQRSESSDHQRQNFCGIELFHVRAGRGFLIREAIQGRSAGAISCTPVNLLFCSTTCRGLDAAGSFLALCIYAQVRLPARLTGGFAGRTGFCDSVAVAGGESAAWRAV